MKKILAFVILFVSFQQIQAQNILGKIKEKVKSDSSSVIDVFKSATDKKSGSGLEKDEIVAGLKEALSVGTKNASGSLHKVDGFFANAALKILMPEEARKAEETLRKFGMGKLVDKAILSMNRAAEDAAGGISDIFVSAIKNMSIKDGLQILRGNDNAATAYLQENTTAQLTEKMRPVIETSLAKVDATEHWKAVFTAYNKFSPTPVDTDLASYVTTKSLQGIFLTIADEEKKIRKDPAAQITPLLKKVFGK